MQTIQGAFTSGELSPSLSARVDFSKYGQGCKTLRNFLVQPHGGAVKRPGFMLVDTLPGEATVKPFVFNTEQAYCLVFGQHWLRVATPQGFIVDDNGAIMHIATPYSLYNAQRLSIAQSGDVLFIACQGVAPHKLMRLGHNRWQFEVVRFECPIASPESVTASFVNGARKSDGSVSPASLLTPYSYTVTALDENGKESEAAVLALITGPASNNWQAGDYTQVAWVAVEGAMEYRVYKGAFGGKPGYIATTGELLYRDYNVSPTLGETPPKWVHPFEGNDFPAVTGFFEQRLVFASTPKRPQTVWLSRSAAYDNFSASSPVRDDDAIELTIASNEVSRMNWLVSLRSLILGGSGVEWELSSFEGAFTARTARVTPQSYRGSAPLPALVVGNTVLHVARSGQEVRDLKYDFGSDSYGGSDRTILARHLFENNTLTDWCYQASPDSIIWTVRNDGALLGMTFQSEHDVTAWHVHTTKGQFKAVTAVPSDNTDVLFAVIQRANGFSLEIMAPRYYGEPFAAGQTCTEAGESGTGQKVLARAVFMDCALVYEGLPVQTCTGLSCLEGEEVCILADGSILPMQRVAQGKIRLPRPASVIIVGLAYGADLQTMPVEVFGEQGASVSRKKVINAVNVLFQDTAAGFVGTDFSRMEPIVVRQSEPYGEAAMPFTGTKRLVVRGGAACSTGVCIRSDAPLPMTVLALSPEVEIK